MEIAALFNQAALSGHHRGICADLKSLQETSLKVKSKEEMLLKEQNFIFSFIKNLNLILAAKRSEEWASRSLHFVLTYLQYSYQKGILSLCFYIGP